MIFILLIVALITRNGDIAWMILLFLVYLGVGILQTPNLEKLSFSANRTLKQDPFEWHPVNCCRCVCTEQGTGDRSLVVIHEAAEQG